MNKKILVVDDEQYIRDIICEYLISLGYYVVAAVDGQDALDKVEMESFDIYIVDIFMPRMDGLQLLNNIKELYPLAVVVVITGYSSIDIAVKAIRNGAFHYLTKPIQEEELLKVVESGLKHANELCAANSQAVPSEIRDAPEYMLLKGFTSEQQHEFFQLGTISHYLTGEKIPLDDQIGTILWLESGRLSVNLNENKIDTLIAGDFWGEETFLTTNAMFTELIAQADTQVRHFNRKNLVEYFTYNEEALTKRFMINLIQCMYLKWRKSLYKISLYTGYKPFTPQNV